MSSLNSTCPFCHSVNTYKQPLYVREPLADTEDDTAKLRLYVCNDCGRTWSDVQ